MKTNRSGRRAGGFSLIEVVAVLAIMVGLAVVFLGQLKQQSATVATSTVVTVQAQEMVALENAAQQYVQANDSGWTVGALQTITVATLSTAGFLPATFANRNGANGTSPLFQNYAVYAILASSDKKPRLVITTTGEPGAGRLARYGLQLVAADIQSLNQQIGEGVQTLQPNIPAGVILGGTQTVTGNYGSFTEDVSLLVATAPTYAHTAMLWGFPDLGPIVGGGSGSTYKYCQVAQYAYNSSTGTYSNPTCASGWTAVGSTPFCGYKNTRVSPQYAVYGTPVGDEVLSTRTWTTSDILTNSSSCACGSAGCSTGISNCGMSTQASYDSSWLEIDLQLNGAIIATDVGCWQSQKMQGSKPGPGGGCSAITTGTWPCVYTLTTTNAAIAGTPQPNQDLLCCLPN